METDTFELIQLRLRRTWLVLMVLRTQEVQIAAVTRTKFIVIEVAWHHGCTMS